MATSGSQSEPWSTRLMRRLSRMLVILAIVLMVIAVLYVLVYGVGVQHHHSNTNHGVLVGFASMR